MSKVRTQDQHCATAIASNGASRLPAIAIAVSALCRSLPRRHERKLRIRKGQERCHGSSGTFSCESGHRSCKRATNSPRSAVFGSHCQEYFAHGRLSTPLSAREARQGCLAALISGVAARWIRSRGWRERAAGSLCRRSAGVRHRRSRCDTPCLRSPASPPSN